MIDWSPQQEQALRACKTWMSNPSSQIFYLAGYAGTGKTTLAKHLVGGSGRWLFAAYTGKASYVLRQKGCEDARTIHSLIYRPAGESLKQEIRAIEMKIMSILHRNNVLTPSEEAEVEKLRSILDDLQENNRPQFSIWINSPLADDNIDGVVIDEVSMVDQRVGKDLESFGKKILVLGDPAQLPPVGAGGYYTKRAPDFMLTEIHRHAKNSGILRLATKIRNGGEVNTSDSSDDVEILERSQAGFDKQYLAMLIMGADQALVGLNKTRRGINDRLRHLYGRTEKTPEPKDRLVCLRNDSTLGIFNGSQWSVLDATADLEANTTWMELESEDASGHKIEVCSWLHHMLGYPEELNRLGYDRRDFTEFDWSYALTVHKAQGSQWGEVVIFDESKAFRQDHRRWLYTGVTRASERLTVVI